MYVTRTRVARSAARVPPTVLALGMVSMCTDISAEMVTAFLPVYLIYGLGAGYLQLGMLDGLYTGATAVLRLVGGHLADRLGRPKAVAAAGYGLSAATKLGFPLVGASVPAIGGLLAIDRAGKGIRTGPRDAIIALVTPPELLGRAFGVHRMLDTFGRCSVRWWCSRCWPTRAPATTRCSWSASAWRQRVSWSSFATWTNRERRDPGPRSASARASGCWRGRTFDDCAGWLFFLGRRP